jgi:hypothetical protein
MTFHGSPMIEQAVSPTCWRPYPQSDDPDVIAAAWDVFWEEFHAINAANAARGERQVSVGEFSLIVAAVWNSLEAWQPDGRPQ